MKALKTCKTGCGKMKSGGPVKKVKRMAAGGAMDKPQIYGIPQTGTTNYSAPTMKKGGMVKKKLAALAAPTNKITRADVIAGALKNKRKKK
jgi:hypothetical protein